MTPRDLLTIGRARTLGPYGPEVRTWALACAAGGLLLSAVAAFAAHHLRVADLSQLVAVAAPVLAITALRACDVMIGVFRTTFIVAGRRLAAAGAAATEAGVWVSAAGIVLSDLTPARGAGFAAGVGLGTLAGMEIVRHLRLGMVTVRLFVPADHDGGGQPIAAAIRGLGHGATVFTGEGHRGPVHMVLTVVRRREARQICDLFGESVFVTLDSDPGPSSVVAGVAGGRV